ncbi:MAG TPA: helix-turn-helix domain-containing protein [Bryobacteraceae bacterium]|nr:helix-turn-helix domain-containing protein [Bryobacteraceae bacterium]
MHCNNVAESETLPRMAKTRGPYTNNLLHLRTALGLTQQDIADATNTNRGHISKLEAGKIGMNEEWMRKLGGKFGWTPSELLNDLRIPIVGEVGAGGEVYPLDDLPLMPKVIDPADEEYINCEWVEAPPGIFSTGIVALRVKGNSMLPFMPEGTVVYYAQRYDGGAPDHCLASLCVVQMRDGRTLLKMVRKGQTHGRFDLQSYNMDTITDVELAWCAPVIFIKPFVRSRS